MSQGVLALFDPLPLLTVAGTEEPALPRDPLAAVLGVTFKTASEYRAFRGGCYTRHAYPFEETHPNPYKQRTPEHSAWARGWVEATPYLKSGGEMRKNGGGVNGENPDSLLAFGHAAPSDRAPVPPAGRQTRRAGDNPAGGAEEADRARGDRLPAA